MMRIQNQGLSILIRKVLLPLCTLLTACSEPVEEAMEESTIVSDVIYYEGARLIIGNGDVIENAIFSVENGLFVSVGSTAA